MTQEQMQITTAYNKILKHLEEQYNYYMKGAEVSPEEYEGIREDDAHVWFIESF